jgi:hypothetical protein
LSAHVEELETIDNNIRNDLLSRSGQKFKNDLIHFFFCVRFRKEDPRFGADKTAYWGETWGKDWADALKGYAVVRLGDTDVGLRLSA